MRIACLPYQPHCFAFGGFELQMLSNINAISKTGTDIVKLNTWQRDADFDILHCWGLGLGNFENIFWAKRSGKKIVLTALLNYIDTTAEKVRFYLSSFMHRERFSVKMLEYVDKAAVVNDLQAEILSRYYRFPERDITVIPHLVDDRFFIAAQENGVSKGEYILTVGNVCHRKNQLNLAEGCVKQGKKLVIIGKVLDGEVAYGQRLQELIDSNPDITWIKGLEENSDSLIQHYKSCACVALPSYSEQQPISLLEGAIFNKPLLIADKSYANQKYYDNKVLVNPASIDSISNGIKTIFDEKYDDPKRNHLLDECRGQHIAMSYNEVYQSIF